MDWRNEWIESNLGKKDLGISADVKNGHDLSMGTHGPKSQPYPELQQKKCSQQAKGGVSPLFETPPEVLHPVLEATVQKSNLSEQLQRWTLKMVQGLVYLSYG